MWSPLDYLLVMNAPLILITNDDGIESPGLRQLREEMDGLGEVFVVAPQRQMSGVSNAISLNRPLDMRRVDDLAVAIDGTPADCVLLALKTVLPRKPDLVISGINLGPNMGFDTIYSGTVAGARVACFHGIPSFAISEVSYDDFQLNHAAHFARRLAAAILKYQLPSGMYLNVNVPRHNEKNPPEYAITHLGQRVYLDQIEEASENGKTQYYIMAKGLSHVSVPGSDCDTVECGHISISPLTLNGTSEVYFQELLKWSI